ncbi:Serine/threonine-protein kinase rio1 [Tilletia horrida]|uniref:non-specific serine/threonine protein kinase n=1 Tax=Tilletia horrida TaxID=155126 RepID=A0AAN6GRF5_9BASI|nr:Serine/threonine-protein kinase rio1 [Tilletia horrida]KAK0567657.1 Serine/threonine-protein kinase rio1 [Tilletia horrida]
MDQFADAPDDVTSDQLGHEAPAPIQASLPRIDDESAPPVGEEQEEEEESDEDYYLDDDDEEEDSDLESIGRVEDADWELARGDFTKQFNRSRQLAAAITTDPTAASNSKDTAEGVALPALNRPNLLKKQKQAKNLVATGPKDGAAGSAVAAASNKMEAQLAALSSHFASRIRVSDSYDPSLAVGGSLNSVNVPRKTTDSADALRVKDKADRATIQQVLDPRTMVILFKMLQRNLIEQVNGCVSTGKEANVYHASVPLPELQAPPASSAISTSVYGTPLTAEQVQLQKERAHKTGYALKIYKTSILVFKDRDRYVSGEFRFRHGYSRHNPRKMVRLWAEKEARNLKRLVSAGLRAPKLVDIRDHVLVMEFLGTEDGWASPRLKDAKETIEGEAEAKSGPSGIEARWEELYLELVSDMRVMYHKCRLVHADLSEYNILYHEGHLWIIDVSQSVEHDHPRSFDFLRADIQHVNDFFAKQGGVKVFGLRALFEYITREEEITLEEVRKQSEEGDDEAIDPALGPGPASDNAGTAPQQSQREKNDAVFAQAYIPRTLDEVYDPERDVEILRRPGGAKELLYASVTGMDQVSKRTKQGDALGAARTDSATIEEDEEDDGSGSDDDSDEGSEGDDDDEDDKEGSEKVKVPRGHRHEDKDAKKERKKEAKEAARERRKTKMPKKEKKARMKKSQAR